MKLVESHIPVAFEPLLSPARYKGAYGGRGGAKSHFFAERILIRAFTRTTRAVAIREIQQSLRDSARQLMVDRIQALGLGSSFEVLDAEIRGPNDSLVIFRGMQSYNAESIKSLEGYDIAWTEEAQTLSQRSLDLLRPTIRKPGSELWFSWNPRHRTDPVDVFFRKRPHPEAVSVCVNWRDNPWFPDVLYRDMLHDYATDPELAEHIYGGAYGVQQGSILGRLVDAADRQGRINDAVEYDPEGPGIEISSDIGFRDTASWWFWQRRIGGHAALLDYMGDTGLDASEWIELLQQRLAEREWPLVKIWLPHDARNKTFQSRHTVVEQFIRAFPGRVDIVPRSSKSDRINAGRTVLPKCEFHRTRCAQGLDGLREWEFELNEETQVYSREPAHTWASHPADAYTYGCQVMRDYAAPEPESAQVLKTLNVGMRSTVTLEDLWEDDRLEREKRVRAWV